MLKQFYLKWKAFDLLNKMGHISWLVVLLEACDVTNNGRHLGRHLGVYQELELTQLNSGQNHEKWYFFCALHEK